MVDHPETPTRKYGNTLVGINDQNQDALAELIASLSNGSEKSDSSDTNTSSAWNAQVTTNKIIFIITNALMLRSCRFVQSIFIDFIRF